MDKVRKKEYERFLGKTLDARYRLEKLLGSGGMAYVFKATDLDSGKPVAVKIIKEEASRDREVLRRFMNEWKAVSMLSHPNIVSVFDISISGDVKYIVLEYVEGISLRDYMDKRGALSFDELEGYTEQILAALAHAHSKGIVHRDIKPQNIMLLKNGYVKVTDFGIAKLPNAETGTVSEKAIGTVYYISPEQAEGENIDFRSDLYSLGIMMYEMATGRLPFDDETAMSVVMMHINAEPVRPREINRKIPKGLETLIMSSIAKKPEDRYQSALDMFRELRRLKRNRRAKVMTPARIKAETRSEKNRSENPPSRSMTPVIIGIALALLLVGIVSAFTVLDRLNIGTLGGKSVTVPNVEGGMYMSEDEIGDKKLYGEQLETLGLGSDFRLEVEYVFSEDHPAGTIIKQNPNGGASRRSPCTVTLTVSKGVETAVLEDFTIMDWRIAQTSLRSSGFTVLVVRESSLVIPSGYVIATDPEPGTKVEIGSRITLRVSIGTEASVFVLPDFTGMTEPEVMKVLDEHQIYVGDVIYTRSSMPSGSIISHEPAEGGALYTGASEVDFVVSGGPDFNTNVYPDVRGLTSEEATARLAVYGLTGRTIFVKSDTEVGTVVVQSPSPESDIDAELTEVILNVSGGPEYDRTLAMYNVCNLPLEDAELLINYGFEGFAVPRIAVIYKRDDAPAGTVIAQSPAPKTRVDIASGYVNVSLTVSGGPDYTVTVTVPDTVGMDYEDAVSLMLECGIEARILYRANTAGEYTVFGQSAAPDTEITGLEGTITVDIYVSRGPGYTGPEIEVPETEPQPTEPQTEPQPTEPPEETSAETLPVTTP